MLFQVKQIYDEDDLSTVYKTERKKLRVSRAKVLYSCVTSLAGALGLILLSVGIFWWAVSSCLGKGPWMLIVPCVAILILEMLFLPPIILLFKTGTTASMWPKPPNMEQELTFIFDEDSFSLADKSSKSIFRYQEVKRFLEKENHFLIYINTGCIPIRKNCFIVGAPEEFGPFMREKYRTKDIDTPEKGLDEG